MTLLRSRESGIEGVTGAAPPRPLLLWVCLGVVLLRATYVFEPLRSDEGGYLLIARQWRSAGEFLYGDYYVDRPPLLMLIFRAAAVTEWDPMVRVITIPFVLLGVVAAWWAGWLVAGKAGAAWSAVVAGALLSSPALAADQADGELFAAALVLPAFALTLAAWRASSARRWWLASAAGLFAGAAPLVKQNFVEGLIFIAVLTVGASLAHGPGRREVAVAAGALAGAAMPHAAMWWWAVSSGFSVSGMWQDLVAFRGSAFGIIWSQNHSAPLERGAVLLVLGLVGGVLALVAVWLAFAWRRRKEAAPLYWAVTAVLVYGGFSITAGGSYWAHYLLELVPGVVLAAGLVAPRASRPGAWMRGSTRFTVATAVLGALVIGSVYLSSAWVWYQERTGQWLADSSLPGDTAFVSYGHASILESADMGSPYPHLWSLPMRTLDPAQERLRDVLEGPQAPAWIVQRVGLNAWDIDSERRLRNLVEQRYRVVAEVCDAPVWLRQDLDRRLAPQPDC